ncbi:MAG: hypothetical protein ACE5KJ_05725, partial [Candidatus Zixiibacteriota bacterium]
MYALKNIDGQMKGNSISKALVVASNTPSSFGVKDPEEINQNWLVSIIFGDGASALVLEGSDRNDRGVLASYWGAWYEHDPMVYPAGGSRNPTTVRNVKDHWYKM